MWGDEAEVIFAQHHWPTWGNENVVELLEKQRDLYRYINDTTLNMVNQGMTMREIAEEFELPENLDRFWASRGYYGSVYHDVAAPHVLYLGWFDGNPSTLQELPPTEAAAKFVEYMGGAQELRNGVAQLPTPNTASPDTVEAMSLDMVFDYAGVRLNSEKAGNAEIKLNFDFGDESGQYLVELGNGVLNHTADTQADDADATITLSRDTLNDIMLQQTSLEDAVSAGDITIDGDQAKLEELLSCLDSFEFWFNIVTP